MNERKIYSLKKGAHFDDELHGRLYDELAEAARADNRSTRFGERIRELQADARYMKRGCEGRKVIAREIETLYRAHRHELTARRIARLQRETVIGAEFADRCREEFYRLTGRTAAENEGRSAMAALDRWLGSWPLRPDRGYLHMLETASERIAELKERVDAELLKHAPKRRLTERTPYRLGETTLAEGGRQ